MVMSKMEKHCIGEVKEIYDRYCSNKRDKLPTESVDCLVAELKTVAKTCNFCDCLRDSLIRDHIGFGIKDEQTTKKLLRIRDLTLNGPFPSCCLSWFRSESWCSTIVREMSLICIRIRNSFSFEWLCTRTHFETEACSNSEMGYWCIDICRSEEITALHMKSLSEPVDNINQVKSKKKKPRVPTPNGQSGKKISGKFCGYEHAPERKKCPAWGKECKRCKKKRIILQNGAKIPRLTPLRSTKTWKVQAMKDKAVFAEMLVQQKPVRFQIDCGACANILP